MEEVKETSKESAEEIKKEPELEVEPEQPQEDAFSLLGDVFQADTLYKVAFAVLGALILLCLVTGFLVDPELYADFLVSALTILNQK